MYKHKLPAQVARHLGVASEDPMMRLTIRGIALWILALAVLGPGAGAGERRESAQEKKEPAKKSSEAAGSTASSAPLANPKDVQSLNAMVAAIYDVISGPPGARDWNRFHSLFAEDARLIAVRVPKDGGKPTLAVMTPKDYEERAGKHFLEHGFFEHEIGRKTDSFGMMTHIYTTYESRETKDGKPIDRGINSMEFFFDGERWWCVGIYWDAERPGNPIPEKYLGK
jgi:hypothetical protein